MTLPLRVQTDPSDFSHEVASRSSTRSLWTGLGFGVLMLIGVSARSLHPLASHASANHSSPVPEVAFHSMPALGPGVSHPAINPASDRARLKAFRAAVVTGRRPSRMANQMSAETEAEKKAAAAAVTAATEKDLFEKFAAEKMFAAFESWMGPPQAVAKEEKVAEQNESSAATQKTPAEKPAVQQAQQAADQASAAEKMFARFDASQQASTEKVAMEKAQAHEAAENQTVLFMFKGKKERLAAENKNADKPLSMLAASKEDAEEPFASDVENSWFTKSALVCMGFLAIVQAWAVRLLSQAKASPVMQEVLAQNEMAPRTQPRLLDGQSLSATVEWYDGERPYTRQELLADRTVNFVAAGLAWLAAIYLGYASWAAGDLLLKQVSFWLHGAGLIIMTNFSAALHYWAWDWRYSAQLLSLDHIGISAMIAGCYAPVMIQSSHYGILALVCLLGLSVLPLEAVRLLQVQQPSNDPPAPGKKSLIEIIHIVRYVVMGWACVAVMPSLLLQLPTQVLQMMFGGGVLYTAGIFVFVQDKLEFHRAIWHATVLAASTIFYLSNLLGLVGLPVAALR